MSFNDLANPVRDELVIHRAETLLPFIEKYAIGEHKEWAIKQLEDYIHKASWSVIKYPLVRTAGHYTALDWAIFPNEDDPVLNEARDRVTDILQIVRAKGWPLVWYEADSAQLSDEDEDEIKRVVQDLHASFSRKDYAHVIALTDLATLHANDFMTQAIDALKREEIPMFWHPDFHVTAIDWDYIRLDARFDGRVVRFRSATATKTPGVFSIGPDGLGFDKSVVLKAVRAPGGWLLAR